MSRPIKFFLTVSLFFIVGIVYFFLHKNTEESYQLKLGWQPPWVNQGQLVEVLKKSNVQSENGISIDFKPFTYGGPMVEAALAGDLDILFVGDQPAITLLSKDKTWRIVARMTNYRSAIIVPINSPLKTIQDLKGKRLASAFGSTTYRDAIRELLNIGINPKKDLQLVNIDQAEHASIISSSKDGHWDGVDAIATYDPTITIGINKNKAKILVEWISPSVVIVKKDVIDKRKDDIKNFLKAYIRSFPIYAKNPSIYNKSYSDESKLDLSDSDYLFMSKMEPNLSIKDLSQVDISISESRKRELIANAELAYKIGIIKTPVLLANFFDESILNTIK